MNLLELMLQPFHASQILTMQKQLKICSAMDVYENLDLSSIKSCEIPVRSFHKNHHCSQKLITKKILDPH